MLEREMLEILEEILVWTKASSFRDVKGMIEEAFSGARSEEKLAYHLLDGNITQGEIVKRCKETIGSGCRISPPSLSIWISKWERLGLVKKKDNKNIRCFSLIDFGIDVPIEKTRDEKGHGSNNE